MMNHVFCIALPCENFVAVIFACKTLGLFGGAKLNHPGLGYWGFPRLQSKKQV